MHDAAAEMISVGGWTHNPLDFFQGWGDNPGKIRGCIGWAMGFALHAVQDSYTPRHAERQGYAGPIIHVWSYVDDRDGTKQGVSQYLAPSPCKT